MQSKTMLRRLMRRIALGLPFAVPLLTAPYNVGGCYPLGYRCPVVSQPQIVEHSVPPDEPLDCERACGDAVDCAVVDSGHVACQRLTLACPPAGRRPTGFVADTLPAAESALGWLSRVAALEAMSVTAFAELNDDLASLGAPPHLLAGAAVARLDEVRHARMVTALVERRGGRVAAPPSASLGSRRSAQELAVDNAVEGCVRETWGAFEAAHQATHARAPDVRAAMGRIARDEAQHALLSFAIDDWLGLRLSTAERAKVETARRSAVVALRRELSGGSRPAELGLPDRTDARHLAHRLFAVDS